jgi:LacI family transcriptional regulator
MQGTFTDDALPRRATIREIAAEAGVSTATVSRVLNDSAGVAPATRALVQEAIEQHRFTGRAKRRRAPDVKDVVAVRCPYVLTDYFGLILSGVAQSLRLHGKRVLFSNENEAGTEPSLPDLLLAELTEGGILILPPEPPAVLAQLRAGGYPFVVIDPRSPPPIGVASVSAAHMAGARAATDHLIELGHTRIAVIAGPPEWVAADGRLAGYRTALAARGQLAPPGYVRSVNEPAVRNGVEAARALLELANPPTAIVAFNDKIAIGAIQAAAERGLGVPEDLSVVGFDALELSQAVMPRLTTVRQPVQEMARIGVELLVRLMEGRDIDTLHVALATELVLGASTAPPR